jgi:hypothetical protein
LLIFSTMRSFEFIFFKLKHRALSTKYAKLEIVDHVSVSLPTATVGRKVDMQKITPLCEAFYSEMTTNRPNCDDGGLALDIMKDLQYRLPLCSTECFPKKCRAGLKSELLAIDSRFVDWEPRVRRHPSVQRKAKTQSFQDSLRLSRTHALSTAMSMVKSLSARCPLVFEIASFLGSTRGPLNRPLIPKHRSLELVLHCELESRAARLRAETLPNEFHCIQFQSGRGILERNAAREERRATSECGSRLGSAVHLYTLRVG